MAEVLELRAQKSWMPFYRQKKVNEGQELKKDTPRYVAYGGHSRGGGEGGLNGVLLETSEGVVEAAERQKWGLQTGSRGFSQTGRVTARSHKVSRTMPFTEIEETRHLGIPHEISSREIEQSTYPGGEVLPTGKKKKKKNRGLQVSFITPLFSAKEPLNPGGRKIKPKVRRTGCCGYPKGMCELFSYMHVGLKKPKPTLVLTLFSNSRLGGSALAGPCLYL